MIETGWIQPNATLPRVGPSEMTSAPGQLGYGISDGTEAWALDDVATVDRLVMIGDGGSKALGAEKTMGAEQ